jgi:hypothetical protein
MATDFSVNVNREADNIHLQLEGDFDTDSALQLFNVLCYCSGMVKKIFLHTGGLRLVHAAGQVVFRSLCLDFQEIQKDATQLTLTGDKIIL